MPPRLPTTPSRALVPLAIPKTYVEGPPVCLFCSFVRPAAPRRARRKPLPHGRRESTAATGTTTSAEATLRGALSPRKELEDVLVELQKNAANFVNLSRIQLALNGLRQPPGKESIRVAVLGLVDNQGTPSSDTTKRLLNLFLADPLKEQQPWEKEVELHDLARPMIVRVGSTEPRQEAIGIIQNRQALLREISVSSPGLDGHNLEFLLMESNPYDGAGEKTTTNFEESVLVPTVDIPISNDGRYTPITTPVHKALIVSDGIMSAAILAAAPLTGTAQSIRATVNLPEYRAKSTEDLNKLPFTPLDVDMAVDGVKRIRENVGEAMVYERQWFQSNLPLVKSWLVADVASTPDGTTKAPVRELIASLLRSTSDAITRHETQKLTSGLDRATSHASSDHLKAQLAAWAQNAHTELQQSLDAAFASRRWRKLGWWKLFWRVDDVGHISTDILSQRFLPVSERSAIFLAGRLEEAGVPLPQEVVVEGNAKSNPGGPSPLPKTAAASGPDTTAVTTRWPTSIPSARKYLQTETIPALQALSQKLVLQALSTSGLTTSLGALVYFGTLTTGIYEAGAVAAVGIVWSLGRLQKKWEKARLFWEGEVREEGRKAVRNAEATFGKALDSRAGIKDELRVEEVDQAKALVSKATEALAKLK